LEPTLALPRLSIERVPIDSLVLDPANARLHDGTNLEAIQASLRRFGQAEPLVVRREDRLVIAGNGRLAAMKGLGWTECDVVLLEVDQLDGTALAIALNRTAELASWDEAVLARVLTVLQGEGALDGTGFTDDEVAALLRACEPEVELNDPGPGELPEDPVTQAGDLWSLGPHRVLCGDSTDPASIQRLLAGEVPQLMVADPPYGVQYDPAWRNEAGLSSTARTGKVRNDDRVDWTAVWQLYPGDVAYVWHAGRHCGEVAANLHAAGFQVRAQIIWAKNRFALSRGNYHWQHEPCWYAVREGGTAHWVGDRSQSTLWDIPVANDGDSTIHGTQKPVECMARPMRNHDAPVVLDPFLGSGSTMIAAHKLGRACLGLELDPAYVDVAVARWERATGKQALLDGVPFAEVARQRKGTTT